MSNNELVPRLLKARYDFAAAVIAYHKSGCKDHALLRRMGESERAYLDAVFTDVAPDIAAAFARRDRDIDQLRKLMAISPEGNA